MTAPPPAENVKAEWPDVEPDLAIDRSIVRCYQCDLAQAHLEYRIAVYHAHVRGKAEFEPSETSSSGSDGENWRCAAAAAPGSQSVETFNAVRSYFAVWGKLDHTGMLTKIFRS